MTATALLAAIAMVVYVPAYDSVCELRTVDRSKTSSAMCIACHDGSAAPPISIHAAGIQGTHPVGVPYASMREEMSLRRYGPTDPLILLPGGRVECVTCHSVKGTGPRWTVASFGALCSACHDK